MDRPFHAVATQPQWHLLQWCHCCALLFYSLAALDTLCSFVDLAIVEVHALASIPS